MLKFGGKVPKLGKLMRALILAGLVQVALDAQDVLTGGHSAFSVEELGVVLQYWSVLISNFRIARSGRELLATTNNETLRLTSNEQQGARGVGAGVEMCLGAWRSPWPYGTIDAGMLFICQRTLFSGSELYFGKAIGLQ